MSDLIVNSPLFDRVGRVDYWIPRGPLVLASELTRAGLDVRLIDLDLLAETDEERSEKITRIIQEERPERIFFSFHGLYSIARIASLFDIGQIRGENPDIRLIAGGSLATVDPRYINRFLDIDQVVKGHVERSTIKQLIDGLQEREEIIRLQPSADSHYSYHLDFGIYENLLKQMAAEVEYANIHLETLRSCPFRCSFCSIPPTFPHLESRRIQRRDIADVKVELEFLASLGIKDISFSDPTFGVDWGYAREVMRLISEYQFSWGIMSRGDVLSEEKVRIMGENGCKSIAIGVETADEGTLRDINKGKIIEKNALAIQAIENEGMQAIALIILGINKRDDFWQIVKFLYENRVNDVVATVYHPVPGSQSFEKDVKKTVLESVRDLEDFDFLGLPVLDSQDAHKLIAQLLTIRIAFRNPHDPDYSPDTEELKRTLAKEPEEFEYMWMENSLLVRIGREIFFIDPPSEYGEFNLKKLTEGEDIQTARQVIEELKTDRETRIRFFDDVAEIRQTRGKARDIRKEIMEEGKHKDFKKLLRQRANKEAPNIRRLLLYPNKTM